MVKVRPIHGQVKYSKGDLCHWGVELSLSRHPSSSILFKSSTDREVQVSSLTAIMFGPKSFLGFDAEIAARNHSQKYAKKSNALSS
jgi:hypothetical protein